MSFHVGQTVRVNLQKSSCCSTTNQRRCRRGMVVTLSTSASTTATTTKNKKVHVTEEVCVFLLHPTSVFKNVMYDSNQHKKLQEARALLSPASSGIGGGNDDDDDVELTVAMEQLEALQPFEQNDLAERWVEDNRMGEIEYLKSCGDALMKLGDEPSAIPYYERALSVSGFPRRNLTIEVGSTIVLQVPSKTKEGNAWIVLLAEVDCVETDDNVVFSMDLTTLAKLDPFHNQRFFLLDEEQTVVWDSRQQFILPILSKDVKNRLQERTLLNLTRCFLQLAAEFQDRKGGGGGHDMISTKSVSTNLSLAAAYLNSAIVSTTLVEAIAQYYQQHPQKFDETPSSHSNETTSREENHRWAATALLLRAKAWLWKGQYALALADTERLLEAENKSGDSTSAAALSPKLLREAQHLHQQILQERKTASKQTRKLVKEVCRWIDGATTSNDSKASSPDSTAPRIDQATATQNSDTCTTTTTTPSVFASTSGWWTVPLILLFALVLQKYLP
ncbi:hypothetical protein ACA910_016066 [Epithemia clementina (nom. ined.)]